MENKLEYLQTILETAREGLSKVDSEIDRSPEDPASNLDDVLTQVEWALVHVDWALVKMQQVFDE